MEADRVVVELIAKVDQFDGKVKATTAGFEGSMARIETAAAKAETTVARSSDARVAALRRESAQISQVSRLLGTQLNDVGSLLVSDKSPFVAPVKQAPAVASAMKVVSLGTSALAGILGGVLVTGALAAAAALYELLSKTDDTSAAVAEMVEKLKEQAREQAIAEQAAAEFARTQEGVTKALDDVEEALGRLENADRSAAHQLAVSARVAQLNQIEIRKTTVALLEQAQAQLEVLRAQSAASGGSLRDTGANAEIGIVEGRLKSLRLQLGTANAELQRAEQKFNEAVSRVVVERASESEIQKIGRKYDALVESTRERLVNEKASTAEIRRQTEALREQQRIDEERERKKKSSRDPNQQSGRQISEAEARAIVASIGGRVNGGFRTPEHNRDVGGVANSYHLKGQALDIAKTAGLTLGAIVKAFEAKGVRLIEKLDEGDHFHVAWAKRGGSGPSQETLAKRAMAAADAEARRQQSYDNELASLRADEIEARQALVTSAEAIAQLELQAIEISRQKYAANLASLVEQRKLLPKEAEELSKLNDERAKLRAELVARREADRKFRMQEAAYQRQLQARTGAIDVEEDLLQSRRGLATTANQRRDLERRLIDLAFQEERLQNEAIIAEYERLALKKNLTDLERQELERARIAAGLAADRMATQGERQANAQAGSAQANASPLQDFFQRIPDEADEINEALESIAAGGLASLADGLTDAIMGFRSLGDVARGVLQQVAAGIIKLGIQVLLQQTVGQVLGKLAVASSAAQAAAVGAAWAPAAALASLATLGANAGPAAAAIASTTALAAAIGASGAVAGGFQIGGYTGNGPVGAPAGIVHGQEYVFDAAATRRIGVRNLEAIRSGGFRPSNAVARQPGGGGHRSGDIAELRGIVQEAITAMPPVQLFPTFDPVRSLEAALASNGGRRVLLDFMGENSGAVSGTLRQ